MKTIIGNIECELVHEMAQTSNSELTLVFKTESSLNEIDAQFSLIDNLSEISVQDDENNLDSLYKNFVEFTSLEKKKDEDGYYYKVKLRKNDLASELNTQITDLQLAIVEIYESLEG